MAFTRSNAVRFTATASSPLDLEAEARRIAEDAFRATDVQVWQLGEATPLDEVRAHDGTTRIISWSALFLAGFEID